MIMPDDINDLVAMQFACQKQSGQSQITNSISQNIKSFKYQIWCFPAGLNEEWHNVANLDDILFVNFKVIKGSTVLAQCLNVNVDHHQFYEPKYLNYHNSIGGFDTIAMHGDADLTGEYSKQDIKLVNVPHFATDGLIQPVDRQGNSLERLSYKGETGFIPKAKLERLRDMLNSNLAYEYLASEQKMIPIRVRTTKAAIWKKSDQIFSLSLDWDEAWADRNFMPDKFLPNTAASCPAVEFFAVTQALGMKARIHWQLADGYDMIEIQVEEYTTAAPTNTPASTYYLTGNKGSVDIDLSNYSYTGVIPMHNLRFWARTVCDSTVNPYTTSAWSQGVPQPIYQYSYPVLRNDFATTFMGAQARTLSFASGANVLANDGKTNNGTWVVLLVASAGSAGGTMTMDPQGVCTYTPPSASFAGVDVFTYQALEQMGAVFGPAAVAKIYVNVATGVGVTVQNSGNLFLRLVLSNYRTVNLYNSTGDYVECVIADMTIYCFKDPMGTIAYDVTGMGIHTNINMTGIDPRGILPRPSPNFPGVTEYVPGPGVTGYPGSVNVFGQPIPTPIFNPDILLSGTYHNAGSVILSVTYPNQPVSDYGWEYSYEIIGSASYYII
jgi:hypothetical protein